MIATSSIIPIDQIEIVNLHDLFVGEFELEAVCLELLEEYPDNLVDIRDERFWSAAGFVRFLDRWINSDFYHLVDPSFVYVEKLWISADRLRRNHEDDISKQVDKNMLEQNIKDFEAVCRAKKFLLSHPDCYVFSNVENMEHSSPFSLHKVSVVDLDEIIDIVHYADVFEDWIVGSYNVLLDSDKLIQLFEEYSEESGLPEDDEQIVGFDNAVTILEQNPSVFVAVRFNDPLEPLNWN
jgi:hypothetical protein